MLSAILIGNNIVNLSASSLTTSLAIKLFGSVGAGVATGILTFLILIFGEVSPKTLATIKADKISLSIAGFTVVETAEHGAEGEDVVFLKLGVGAADNHRCV